MRPEIVIGSLAPWKEQLYHKFIQSTFIGQKSGEDFYYLVLFGEGNDMQAFRKKISSVHGANSLFQESVSYRKRTVPFFTGTALGGIHILHNRKKTILITFFISICIAGIPLSILLLIQRYNCRVLKQTVSAYEAEQNAYVDTNVYLLSKHFCREH